MPRRRDGSDGLSQQDVEQLLNAAAAGFQRLSLRARIAVVIAIVLAGIVVAVVYFRSLPAYTQTADTADLLLGNPSGASTNPADQNNFLMVKPYFVLSYNSQKGTPNWVSWHVTAAYLGDAPRKQVFDPDDSLPIGFKVVRSSEYSGSGFDRGHMCPHGDRCANVDMSYSTFIMTNIIPQAPNVNRKAWDQLEVYCRGLARQHNHLYIQAGPIGIGGIGSRGSREYIGNGMVNVPAECWKVIVVVPEDGGDDDLAKINTGTRVIAVDMPNNQDVVSDVWDIYRTSVAAIEQKTGFQFFDRLRPDLAATLKQKVDDIPIPPPRPLGHGDQNRYTSG